MAVISVDVMEETMNAPDVTVPPKEIKSQEKAGLKPDMPPRTPMKPVAAKLEDNVDLPVVAAPEQAKTDSAEISPSDNLELAAVEQSAVANSPIANASAPPVSNPALPDADKSPEPEAVIPEPQVSKTEPALEPSPAITPSEPERKVDDLAKNDENEAVQTAQAVSDNADKADTSVNEPVAVPAQPQVENVKSTPSMAPVSTPVKRDKRGARKKNAPVKKTLDEGLVASIENVGSNSMPSVYQYGLSLNKAATPDTLRSSDSPLIPPPPPRLNDIEIALMLPAEATDIKARFYRREHPMDSISPAKRKDLDLPNAEYSEQSADKGRRQMTYSVPAAAKGTYVMLIEHEGNDSHGMEERIILYAGKPGKRNKAYTDVVEGVGRSRRLFIFPEAVFWDDDKWFSGYAESSDTITRFNSETGLVWKELRVDLDGDDSNATQVK